MTTRPGTDHLSAKDGSGPGDKGKSTRSTTNSYLSKAASGRDAVPESQVLPINRLPVKGDYGHDGKRILNVDPWDWKTWKTEVRGFADALESRGLLTGEEKRPKLRKGESDPREAKAHVYWLGRNSVLLSAIYKSIDDQGLQGLMLSRYSVPKMMRCLIPLLHINRHPATKKDLSFEDDSSSSEESSASEEDSSSDDSFYDPNHVSMKDLLGTKKSIEKKIASTEKEIASLEEKIGSLQKDLRKAVKRIKNEKARREEKAKAKKKASSDE